MSTVERKRAASANRRASARHSPAASSGPMRLQPSASSSRVTRGQSARATRAATRRGGSGGGGDRQRTRRPLARPHPPHPAHRTTPLMRIELGEWCIRSLVATDAESIAKYANNRRVSLNLRDRFPYPYTRADAEAFLAAAAVQRPETDFAIASSKEVIGGIGFHPQSDVHRLTAAIR